MKKILIIEADTNDADYVTSEHTITDKQVEELKSIIKVIKACEADCNWCSTGYDDGPEVVYKGKLTDEQIELMSDLVPSGGEYGIHTITSIRVLEVVKTTKLL